MKQILQNYKTGELRLADVPRPALRAKGVLVATRASLISAGTEKMKVDVAKKKTPGDDGDAAARTASGTSSTMR